MTKHLGHSDAGPRAPYLHPGGEYISIGFANTPDTLLKVHGDGEIDRARAAMWVEQVRRLMNAYAVARRIAGAQAEDDALWDPQTVVEGYITQELRAMHAAVEGDPDAKAAVED